MNQNKFLTKTVKTFLTSLLVSVFVFGSFYFLLSDNSSDTTRNTAEVKSEKSKKLVVDEEEKKPAVSDNKQLDTKQELSAVSKTTETEREVLGATTTNLIAQLPSDLGNVVNTAVVQTTPTAAITGTLPSSLVANNGALVATGVPKTGNESLYVILGIFSLVTGFFIANGKSLAMNSFEREI